MVFLLEVLANLKVVLVLVLVVSNFTCGAAEELG